MKAVLRRTVSERNRRRVRRLGRVRWFTKLRVLRRSGASPLRWWRYLLFDPEVDSFTYAIANRAEVAAALARVLPQTQDDVERCLEETDSDQILRRALRQPWRHALWSKRVPEPRGYHQACWAITRLTKPSCVVETGILEGMGSVVILAALERNATEGHEGELISFDVMPGAGALVPPWLRRRWSPVYVDAVSRLDEAIGSRRIGFLTSDSLPDASQIRRELEAGLRHRDEQFIASTTWGSLDLDWPTDEIVTFTEQPVDHFYGGMTGAVARF
jgi:hypothetical protein